MTVTSIVHINFVHGECIGVLFFKYLFIRAWNDFCCCYFST